MYSASKTPAVKHLINSVRFGASLFGLGLAVSFGTVQAQPVTGQQPVPFYNMDGSEVYLTFCAGCHGFDGIAAYPPAPSFALGERLHQSGRRWRRPLENALRRTRTCNPLIKSQLLCQIELAGQEEAAPCSLHWLRVGIISRP